MEVILNFLAQRAWIAQTSERDARKEHVPQPDGFEAYLLAHSDTDARWYYERRCWCGGERP